MYVMYTVYTHKASCDDDGAPCIKIIKSNAEDERIIFKLRNPMY